MSPETGLAPRDSRLIETQIGRPPPRRATDRTRDRQPTDVGPHLGRAARGPAPAGRPAAGSHLHSHRGPLDRRAAAGALRRAGPAAVPGHGRAAPVRWAGP